jgi:hypothetical protein
MMRSRRGLLSGFLGRAALVVLTLVGHLLAAVGFPLPAPCVNAAREADQPFPCQDHPCGCRTAEQCWQGDCCCFTLEEKVTWADARGIEPPPHVRPLLQLRKQQVKPRPVPACCCSEPAEQHQEAARPATSSCCQEATQDRPAGSVNPVQENSPAATVQGAGVRWVIGIFAQKCRGQGCAGLFSLDVVLAVDLPSDWRPDDRVEKVPAGFPTQPPSISHGPAIPPPRRF